MLSFKFENVITVLRELVQTIFDSRIIPSLGSKAIFPILKEPSSDKWVPLKYRRISLLSCSSKFYSSILNRRLGTYLENNDIIAEEQTGSGNHVPVRTISLH